MKVFASTQALQYPFQVGHIPSVARGSSHFYASTFLFTF